MKFLTYFRAVLLAVFVVVHTLICSLVVISMLVLRFPRRWVDWVIGPMWCGAMVWLSGLRPETKGIDNVPTDRGFLYLFTHSSHLDIPVLFQVSPKSFRFGAKSSLFKIPIFGYAVTLSGTLPITREDRNKVMEVYRQAEERVAQGEAFALSPEGGRRQSEEIKEFKSGPFIFAMNARMPIVPVVICGVDRALKKGSVLINKDRWLRPVGVSFLPARELPEMNREQLREYKTQLREEMVGEYKNLSARYL
jgi:1-acyl-sn-glycerol-3-phosphate acyltransferase